MPTSAESKLVGDIHLAVGTNQERGELVMKELEEFMEKYNIDFINVCWSRSALLKDN